MLSYHVIVPYLVVGSGIGSSSCAVSDVGLVVVYSVSLVMCSLVGGVILAYYDTETVSTSDIIGIIVTNLTLVRDIARNGKENDDVGAAFMKQTFYSAKFIFSPPR